MWVFPRHIFWSFPDCTPRDFSNCQVSLALVHHSTGITHIDIAARLGDDRFFFFYSFSSYLKNFNVRTLQKNVLQYNIIYLRTLYIIWRVKGLRRSSFRDWRLRARFSIKEFKEFIFYAIIILYRHSLPEILACLENNNNIICHVCAPIVWFSIQGVTLENYIFLFSLSNNIITNV